jgi:hypothetical protein
MKLSHCKSCKSPIYWTVTPKGKRMPVDAKPVEVGGNVVLIHRPEGDPIAKVVAVGQGSHTAHFTSCPDAEEHKR